MCLVSNQITPLSAGLFFFFFSLGGKDRRSGLILTIPLGSDQTSMEELSATLDYLLSIPRYTRTCSSSDSLVCVCVQLCDSKTVLSRFLCLWTYLELTCHRRISGSVLGMFSCVGKGLKDDSSLFQLIFLRLWTEYVATLIIR